MAAPRADPSARAELEAYAHGMAYARGEHYVTECEPVGEKQIADRLGVAPDTPQQWYRRGELPPEWGRVGNGPAWCWPHQIVPWAKREPADSRWRSRWDRRPGARQAAAAAARDGASATSAQ